MIRTADRDPTRPLLSGAWFQSVLQSLDDAGAPVADILRDLRIDPASLTDPDRRTDRDTETLLWQEAARRTADPSIGIRAAARYRFGLNNVVAHLMVSSANLGEALAALVRFQTLVASGRIMALENRGEDTALLIDLVEGRRPVLVHQTEFVLGVMAQVLRSVAEHPVALGGVRFRHAALASEAPHRQFFGCDVRFRAGENSLLVASSSLKEPCRDRAANVALKLRAVAEDDLLALEGPSISYLVAVTLRRRLAAGDVAKTRLEELARELHVSERSLQRRLAEESASHAALLDQARRDLALHLIEEGLSREAVASRLGFSGTRTLLRALRRWRGESTSHP